MNLRRAVRPLGIAIAALFGLGAAPTLHAWEPSKPIEFVVPAGTGGGADQMARFIQGVAAKNKLTAQPIVVVNKSGGAGAEGFLDVKGDKGNGHKIIITLSNLFTTPLATGVPFNWRDLTPVQMLALDQFVLWVNEESPHKTAKAYFDAVKAGNANQFKMGGTGSKQEDQIITVMLEKAAGKKITYIPFKGGWRRGGTARGQAHRLDGQQPDRGRVALARRQVACAVRHGQGPVALQRQGDWHPGLGRSAHLRLGGHSGGVRDVARHFHAAWRDP